MNHLSEIQKWVQSVITQPQGIQAGADAAFKDIGWDIDTVVAPSNTLTSYERINIYHRSYFARLLDCFKSEYSGLLNALGDELFNHFVWSYLQKHPSTSYTLNDLGKKFPDFLEETLVESLKGESPDWWQLFIIDIAKYERTFTEVFNGLGHEELKLNEFFATTPLKLSPSVKILALNYPISDCINEFRKNKPDAYPEIEKTNYLFTRCDYQVQVFKISNEEKNALQNWIKNSSKNCSTKHQIDWTVKGVCY